jgi:hypothetical protein
LQLIHNGFAPPSARRAGESSPHIVTITKIGYEDYTQNVFVTAGSSEMVTATLPEKTFPYYTLNPTSAFTVSPVPG